MEKFRELLFLNNIYRVAKKTIYDNYWNILKNSNNFDDLVNEMISIKGDDKIQAALNKSEKIYEQVINDDEINVITVFDDDYPQKLDEMGNERPLILYVKGNIEALNKPNISIIGTRKPSELSQEFEEKLVKSIINSTNCVVVSGLAFGCDKIAHQTTIDGDKITIAVLPSGVNVIKPAKHKKLAEEIIKTGGCLVSEYEPNKKPYKSEYVERDKIIAAFSDVTFVVECGVKSGTMHTVDAANKYNRQIYVYLPDERPKDSFDGNELIITDKDGIKVEDIDEFLEDLNSLKNKKQDKSEETTVQAKLF